MYILTKLRILWYTRPSIKPYLGFLLIMSGFLAMMGYLRSLGLVDDSAWWIVRFVGGGIILAVLLPYLWGYAGILRAFRRADKESRLELLCEDFEDAQPIARGYARMGTHFFFGKGGRNVVPYEDIRQVRLHEHYAGLQRNQRELHYIDTNGNERPLCGLPLFGGRGIDIAHTIQRALAEKLQIM